MRTTMQDYLDALRVDNEATEELELSAHNIRKEAADTAKTARSRITRGFITLGVTLAVWIATLLFDLPMHHWGYYAPAAALGLVMLGIGFNAKMICGKYQKMLVEIEHNLKQR